MTTRKIAIARAVGVIGATVALVTGVTFAALSSSATLSDNNISSASAALEINGVAGSQPGFNLTDYVPGTDQPASFSLTNNGGVPLNISVQAVPDGNFSNVGITDYSGVHVTLENADDADAVVANTNFGALLTGITLANNPMAVGTIHYIAVLNIDSSVVSGSQVSLNHFDIVFTGTQ